MSARFLFRHYLSFAGLFLIAVIVVGLGSSVLPGLLQPIVQSFAGVLAAMYAGYRIMDKLDEVPSRGARLMFSVLAPCLMLGVLFALLMIVAGQSVDGIAGLPMSDIAIGMPIILILIAGSTYAGLAIAARE